MIKTLPAYLYHREYGARIFVSADDVTAAKKVGWKDSPAGLLQEEEREGRDRDGVENSLEVLNAELEKAVAEPDEATKRDNVAATEAQIHNANKEGIAMGEREDQTSDAGDRLARMGLDAAASTAVAPKKKK
ncbi:hypothetical protein J0X19_11775 [Hymenobacter sp. BT186]|uniref:Uncharacterized protein n=1 Tax=Hymenobacter telluris TaxID=2816474 RepID=A0A939EX27_9BACT|nr:hypothetical protein [Hymenobacter telluris]MBO0358626.1 hypothetical protein [Hymenobacter telluris]MBW3374652.1 hypothetical protein [Hymenobacter norwichensis]